MYRPNRPKNVSGKALDLVRRVVVQSSAKMPIFVTTCGEGHGTLGYTREEIFRPPHEEVRMTEKNPQTVRTEVPEFCAEVERLRVLRGWSRPKLVQRLIRELEATEDPFDCVSEAWLGRLEKGQVAKIPRFVVNALIRALRCTMRERVSLLRLADRNPFVETSYDSDEVKDVLTFLLAHIGKEVYEIFAAQTSDRPIDKWSELELLEVLFSIMRGMEHRIRRSIQEHNRH